MFHLLGPLAVSTANGAQVEVRGARNRVVLASLLLNANRVVSTGALLASAWHGKDPAGAENVLEAQVKRLRAKLDSWDPGGRGRRRLATRVRGYLLHVDEGELDVDRFTALRARGRALLGEDPRAAGEVFGQALALWRGEALQDLDSPVCEAAAVRLEQARTAVREDLVRAELTAGRHREVLDELHELVLAHPLRETFHDFLMVALYRSGFVGEALSTYRRARGVFLAELGIEPSPLLRRRVEMILRNDPGMAGLAASPVV